MVRWLRDRTRPTGIKLQGWTGLRSCWVVTGLSASGDCCWSSIRARPNCSPIVAGCGALTGANTVTCHYQCYGTQYNTKSSYRRSLLSVDSPKFGPVAAGLRHRGIACVLSNQAHQRPPTGTHTTFRTLRDSEPPIHPPFVFSTTRSRSSLSIHPVSRLASQLVTITKPASPTLDHGAPHTPLPHEPRTRRAQKSSPCRPYPHRFESAFPPHPDPSACKNHPALRGSQH